MWYVYMVKCSDDSFYTGITTDVKRRVREHNGSVKNGARYTYTRRPVRLVFSRNASDRSDALRLEARIKLLSHAEKLQLI